MLCFLLMADKSTVSENKTQHRGAETQSFFNTFLNNSVPLCLCVYYFAYLQFVILLVI